MSNRFQDIVHQWYQQKDQLDWVLATIIQTKGSSYRKAGAHMMINDLGQSFGLLSGGCLEADLKRRARRCWATNQSQVVCYDMSDATDIAWQLGIGCGGMVRVLIQPISQANHYHNLHIAHDMLMTNQSVCYQQSIDDSAINCCTLSGTRTPQRARFDETTQCFTSMISTKPKLVIFGGGVDTLPLVSLAKTMAWDVTLIDARSNYARPSVFKNADEIINQPYQSLVGHPALIHCDAIVVMHHNIEHDAHAIALAQHSKATYLGLLGPKHRTERVFEQACLQDIHLRCPLTNPIGLDLGGDLPETIALSIVSQIQAHLSCTNANPLGTFAAPMLDTEVYDAP